MLKEKEAVIRKAIIGFDAFLVCVAFALTFLLRKHFHVFYRWDLVPSAQVVRDMSAASFSDYVVVLLFLVPLWCVMLYLNGMYRSMRTATLLRILWVVIRAAFFTTIAFGTAGFLFKLHFVSRVFFAIFMAASTGMILAEKVIVFYVTGYVRRHGYNFRRILLVGTGRRAANFVQRMNSHPEWGFRIVGAVDYEAPPPEKEVAGLPVLGTLEGLEKLLDQESVDEVVFIVPRSKLGEIEGAIYACETAGVKATVAVDLFDMKIARSRLTELDGIPLVTFETTLATEWQLLIKRAADLVAAGAAIIVLSPVLMAVALLIKATSAGPVFYRQKRVGLNGRRFVLYKFRSMHKGAHERQSEIMPMNIMKGPVFKMKDDPRITPFGRFMRKFSIDELPQLFNVFMGHMSLVGPRPLPVKEAAQQAPWQRRRLSMRPGLTCLWQVSGRNKIAFEEWMRLDLQYIDNWSLWLDFYIIMKTIPVVIFGIGAY